MGMKIWAFLCLSLLNGCWSFLEAESFKSEWKKAEVKKVMQSVADWQIEHFKEVPYSRNNWINAAMYLGMFEWGRMADTLDKKPQIPAIFIQNRESNRLATRKADVSRR